MARASKEQQLKKTHSHTLVFFFFFFHFLTRRRNRSSLTVVNLEDTSSTYWPKTEQPPFERRVSEALFLGEPRLKAGS
jgi:hypothetical protein